MKRHLAYLKYVIRHKWFVFQACLKMHAPLWRAIIHDWHKFLPDEWFPYAEYFYNPDGTKAGEHGNYKEEGWKFKLAWCRHQKRGKHHWQAWLVTFDRGETEALDMPTGFILEMIADWWGAGRAITGKWEAHHWYEKNKDKMNLSPVTRRILEWNLKESENRFETPEVLLKRRMILGY